MWSKKTCNFQGKESEWQEAQTETNGEKGKSRNTQKKDSDYNANNNNNTHGQQKTEIRQSGGGKDNRDKSFFWVGQKAIKTHRIHSLQNSWNALAQSNKENENEEGRPMKAQDNVILIVQKKVYRMQKRSTLTN